MDTSLRKKDKHKSLMSLTSYTTSLNDHTDKSPRDLTKKQRALDIRNQNISYKCKMLKNMRVEEKQDD